MMESMMKLPDDMFRLELLQYLSVDDIVKLDSACMNHKYRHQLLEKITDASLIAIAKNCTGLQHINTSACDVLSSYKLRSHFNSVSELRATLLSIYPYLPI